MGTTLRVLYDGDEGMTLGSWGNIFLVAFRAQLTVNQLRILRDHQTHYMKSLRSKFAVFTALDVTERDAIGTRPEAHEYARQIAREVAPHMICDAILFERDGFLASLLRSIVTSVNLVTRHGFPMRIFPRMYEATSWIDSQLGVHRSPDFDTAALADALNACRERKVALSHLSIAPRAAALPRRR